MPSGTLQCAICPISIEPVLTSFFWHVLSYGHAEFHCYSSGPPDFPSSSLFSEIINLIEHFPVEQHWIVEYWRLAMEQFLTNVLSSRLSTCTGHNRKLSNWLIIRWHDGLSLVSNLGILDPAGRSDKGRRSRHIKDQVLLKYTPKITR